MGKTDIFVNLKWSSADQLATWVEGDRGAGAQKNRGREGYGTQETT